LPPAVDCYAGQAREFGAGRLATVTAETLLAVAGDGGADARGVQLTKPIVAIIGDVDVAGSVDRYAEYALKLSDGGDDARSVHFADPVRLLGPSTLSTGPPPDFLVGDFVLQGQGRSQRDEPDELKGSVSFILSLLH
jgi:hypothetical protein